MTPDQNGLTPDGHVTMPRFSLFGGPKGSMPHSRNKEASVIVENEYGVPIEYAVYSTRKRTAWWITATLNDIRASNTMRTTSSRVADAWISAVQRGDVCVAREDPQEVERQLEAAIARSRARRGA